MARIATVAAALVACVLLGFIIISDFVTGTLTDRRFTMDRNVLASGTVYFPNSARLHARLARAEMLESARDLDLAETHAARAVYLSPHDYNSRLLLASVLEMKGDRAAAEESLREALALAPNNRKAHWQLANLLLRQGRLNESLEEFHVATRSDRSLLPATLDLLWRASNGDVGTVKTIAGNQSQAKFLLIQFLVKQSRAKEAAEVFTTLDRDERLASAESATFLNSLVAGNHLELAREIWSDVMGSDSALVRKKVFLLWNGGFESDILKGFTQFDWEIEQSKYARVLIDTGTARTGSRSLRIDFAGQNTTVLDGEVKQRILVRAGRRYRLECYVKTQGLTTPEGPRVVISDGSSKWIAASSAVASGSSDWQHLTVDFVAPPGSEGNTLALYVSIKRKPEFSYDDPTRGTIWFDDFKIIEP
ncbi:MAG: tetratricopeptide repeat protein [Blastocatellia bacterium]|nr:tetratricopeptide repeat protein [Blastocatellia bacterium]